MNEKVKRERDRERGEGERESVGNKLTGRKSEY